MEKGGVGVWVWRSRGWRGGVGVTVQQDTPLITSPPGQRPAVSRTGRRPLRKLQNLSSFNSMNYI